MSRISRGSLSRKKKVAGIGVVSFEDGVFRFGVFGFRRLVDEDVLVDAVGFAADFACCRILELRRPVGISAAVTGVIIESC